jgi:FkbM family methyltransferase
MGPAVRWSRQLWRRLWPLTVEERYAQRDNDGLRRLLSFTLKPTSNCIDVGAGLGDVLAEIMRVAPSGAHIAYEPLRAQFEVVRSRFPGADVRCAALSDVKGVVSFVHARDLPAYSGFRRRDYPRPTQTEVIMVRTERLDDAIPSDYVPDLIKIDVEGAEMLVLKGARETLARHRPVVVFEYGRGTGLIYGTSPDDIHALFCAELGMRLFDLDGNGPLSLEEFRVTPRWNFVARD